MSKSMTTPIVRLIALFGAAWLSLGAAGAAELTLYSRDNFEGREMTLRDSVADLSRSGFNDRASSMIVRSGRWEVCVRPEFQGRCAVVERGEYPTLERFGDRISSIREIERGRAGGGGRERGRIELYSQRDMGGQSTRLRRDSEDLAEIGFNDRAESVEIEDGNWQLCSDAGFRGTCREFGPGTHGDLGRGLRGRVSSARLVDGRGGYGRPDGGGYDYDRPEPRPRGDDVEMFADAKFGGMKIALNGDVRNLRDVNMNDRADSIIVHRGTWEFCVDADFRGQCVTYGPGRYERLGTMGSILSSARRVR